MLTILAVIFTVMMVAVVFLNFFSLPGNWLMFVLLLLWMLIGPATISWWHIIFMGLIITLAEVLEFAIAYYGSKRFGGTREGNWGGIIGAIVGSLIGAPFFFGLGALPGALVGAFGGCFVFEIFVKRRTFSESGYASWGAMWGTFFGISVKIALGVFVVVMSVPKFWVR